MTTLSDDPWSRVDYRRLIAWPERIRREWPLLERILTTGPSRRVLDLGCGPGEHSRKLAEEGFEVVGIDASPAMLEKAREAPVPGNLRFVLGDIRDVAELADGSFGGAVCLGNILPGLTARDDLLRLARGLRQRLLPGAPFLLQVLNYDRIHSRRERYLPPNFRPCNEGAEGEEIVFVRLMDPREDGSVLFYPVTLRVRPGQEPPVEMLHTREVHLRGWRREEIESVLEEAGFRERRAWGGFDESPWEALESRDLLLVAR